MSQGNGITIVLTTKEIVAVVKACMGYFIEEQGKLGNEKTVWHISADSIESLFGSYKSRKSPIR
jgi:ABC-type methionine transport system ATPase subunit